MGVTGRDPKKVTPNGGDTMPENLSDAAIRNAKPKDKPYKLFDGDGLFLLVTPKGGGGKWWRFKYRFNGKEKLISFGTYPETGLAEARERKREARKLIQTRIDPGEERKASRARSFEATAREWVALNKPGWSPSHSQKTISILEKDIFPFIGSQTIGEITAPRILELLRRIDTRTSVTARKAYSACRQIFLYAIAHGRATANPVDGLTAFLSPKRVKHMAAPTDPTEVGRLLRTIEGYTGTFTVRCALMLSPLFFVRPGTLHGMEWQNIHLDQAEWRIPIEQLKRKQIDKDSRRGEVGLIVPLPRQAVVILRELYHVTGKGQFAFPGPRDKTKCISDNTVRSALRGMGFTGEDITPHGFRHMASTLLHELGFPSHLIEKQMAHCDKNRIRAVYNHAEYLPERQKMMQAWADYLDRLAASLEDKIVSIARSVTR
jgi:integrase